MSENRFIDQIRKKGRQMLETAGRGPEESDLRREIKGLSEEINSMEMSFLNHEDRPENLPCLNRDVSIPLELLRKEEEEYKDRLIWKAYSQHEGIYDTLTHIKRLIEQPPVNAFSFDEERGYYTIFIALYNTYIKKLYSLWSKLRQEYELSDGFKSRGLLAEYEEIKTQYSKLKKEEDGLQKQYSELQGQCRELQKARDWSLMMPGRYTDELMKKRQESVDIVKRNVQCQLIKAEEHDRNIRDYRKQMGKFKEACQVYGGYRQRYQELYEGLKPVCEIQNEDNRFHGLSRSPGREEGVEGYMETAHAFCREISQIRDKYPL